MPNPNGYVPTLIPKESPWINKPTRTIRVPVVLANQILEYAYKLDKGEPVTQSVQPPNGYPRQESLEALTQSIQMLKDVESTGRTNFNLTKKRKVSEVIKLLEAMTQSVQPVDS
jgi:hypothetical protein